MFYYFTVLASTVVIHCNYFVGQMFMVLYWKPRTCISEYVVRIEHIFLRFAWRGQYCIHPLVKGIFLGL